MRHLFEPDDNPEQIQFEDFDYGLMINKLDGSLNAIKCGDNLVGHAFLFKTTRDGMSRFTQKKITERELFISSLEEKGDEKDTVYLCAAFVLPEYRNLGLASQSFKFQIQYLLGSEQKPDLFFWAFSEEGRKLSQKIATDLGCHLYERTE